MEIAPDGRLLRYDRISGYVKGQRRAILILDRDSFGFLSLSLYSAPSGAISLESKISRCRHGRWLVICRFWAESFARRDSRTTLELGLKRSSKFERVLFPLVVSLVICISIHDVFVYVRVCTTCARTRSRQYQDVFDSPMRITEGAACRLASERERRLRVTANNFIVPENAISPEVVAVTFGKPTTVAIGSLAFFRRTEDFFPSVCSEVFSYRALLGGHASRVLACPQTDACSIAL